MSEKDYLLRLAARRLSPKKKPSIRYAIGGGAVKKPLPRKDFDLQNWKRGGNG